MPRARPVLVLPFLALAACAGPGRSRQTETDFGRTDDRAISEVQARLASRAASLLGHRSGFVVGAERFNGDCSGFVEAVYAHEGIPLRPLMRAAAPSERAGVEALYRAVQRNGVVFGGGGEWPAPGDLVFWRDTYDRNRNGRSDDGLTHVGIVEYVVDGTVVFVHRGARAVARGAMTPDRPSERSANGVALNSWIRSTKRRPSGGRALAGELFAGYGRLDPARVLRSTGVAAAARRPAAPPAAAPGPAAAPPAARASSLPTAPPAAAPPAPAAAPGRPAADAAPAREGGAAPERAAPDAELDDEAASAEPEPEPPPSRPAVPEPARATAPGP